MSFTKKADWLIPAGLLVLSFVPILASVVDMTQIIRGVQARDNARFLAMPWPISMHLVGMVIFCIAGALQFSAGLRRSKPSMHRFAGWVAIPSGLVGAASGLWMTLFYPMPTVSPAMFDGTSVQIVRLLVSFGLAICLLIGTSAILCRNILQHRNWMMRGYALALGAGTQVFTHIPWLLFPNWHGELLRTLCMAAGWLINLAVVEVLISRDSIRRQKLFLQSIRQASYREV